MLLRLFMRSIVIAMVLVGALAQTGMAQVEQAPIPSVPEIYTIRGEFSRIAYNNEGWVTLGYRLANASQGNEWMLLEAGVTIIDQSSVQTLTRDNFMVRLPDDTIVPLASQEEFAKAGHLRSLNARADTIRDSINYFPTAARRGCAMRFFAEPTNRRAVAFDQFDVTAQQSCLGRLFFKMPEGRVIETGQYWLRVTFDGSIVEVPFRIMTKEEEKFLRKNWKDLQKEHEAYLKRELEKAKQQQ